MSLYNKLMHCIFMNFSLKAETLVKNFEKLFFWDFVGSNILPQMETKLNFYVSWGIGAFIEAKQ